MSDNKRILAHLKDCVEHKRMQRTLPKGHMLVPLVNEFRDHVKKEEITSAITVLERIVEKAPLAGGCDANSRLVCGIASATLKRINPPSRTRSAVMSFVAI